MNIKSPGPALYFPKYSGYLFAGIFLLLSVVYNYHNVLFYRPQGMHQWRQTDCLSFTLHYYYGNSFFKPAIHYLGENGTGQTVSECPIIYYFTAQLWKIFGPREYILRLVNLLIVFCGLFALFKLSEGILRDSFWALCIPVLLFTSPILAYYSNNFLPNAPALGFTLIGWLFFWKYYTSQDNKLLYASCLFFALAGLLKASSAMSFFALVIIYLLETIFSFSFRENGKVFAHPGKQIIPFILAFCILLAWYAYGYYYNHTHETGIFLLGADPFWETSVYEIKRILHAMKEHAKWSYFRPAVYVALLLFIAFIAMHARRISRLLLLLSLLLSLGAVSFMVLFFQFLDNHDYYMLDTLIVLPILFLTFLVTLKKNRLSLFNSLWIRFLALGLIIHCADFANRRMDSRYAGWMNETHLKYTRPFENITPYLRSIGITRDDKVICLPDKSLEITLYLMDQKGWTNYGELLERNGLAPKVQMGAKYLLIYDKALYHDTNVQQFLKNKIGQYETVEIFKL